MQSEIFILLGLGFNILITLGFADITNQGRDKLIDAQFDKHEAIEKQDERKKMIINQVDAILELCNQLTLINLEVFTIFPSNNLHKYSRKEKG